MSDTVRSCPICNGQSNGVAFPFSIEFDGNNFDYHQCERCCSIFVNPVPNSDVFSKMYAKSEYHDTHYVDCNQDTYDESAMLLMRFAPRNALVLDYGCGIGSFLKATKACGFIPYGVEFDAHAARFAADNIGCTAVSVDTFFAQCDTTRFDVIHLGDVLEHLPNPAYVLDKLLDYLKPGGLLYVEGPLEINPSPVYWASALFGTIKHWLRPNFVGIGKPTHLFRVGAQQQLAFFLRIEPSFNLRYWQVYETGWPYISGNIIKRSIARIAIRIGGRNLFGSTFGNRFRGVFVCHRTKECLGAV